MTSRTRNSRDTKPTLDIKASVRGDIRVVADRKVDDGHGEFPQLNGML